MTYFKLFEIVFIHDPYLSVRIWLHLEHLISDILNDPIAYLKLFKF